MHEMAAKKNEKKGQSSLELLVTLSFGLIILLPIVVLAFIQIAASSSTLATTEAQESASKLANIALSVGSQGYPARQLTLIQMPPDVYTIYVGNINNTMGHEIIFIVRTNVGNSYVTAYTPINISGNIGSITNPGTYLVNISAENSCPSAPAYPCVYISPS
jgi:hypothetical protein